MVHNRLKSGKSTVQILGLILGPLLFIGTLLFSNIAPENPVLIRMIAVTLLMVVWWITDAIPLFATALLPMIFYPLLGILKSTATAPIYFNSIIFLFLGGFMIALTMEKWNLHKRIALFIIKIIGGGPHRIILGFMLASAFLSMWISNTATAIMMVPIGLAIVLQLEEDFGVVETGKFTTCLMLGIAYACSIGGIATLVGTPPNLSFVQIFHITFPAAEPIAFGDWMLMAFPISVLMLLVVWLMLSKILFRIPARLRIDQKIINQEYVALGPMRYEEKAVMIIFSLTAVLWVFRKSLNLGFVTLPGWSQLLPYPALVDDATVALTMAMLMFIIPAQNKSVKSATLMGADVVNKLPWNIVLLFGGGFALAKGFQVTGLSAFIGNQFSGLAGTPPLMMILSICSGIIFLTELTSNTATTEMILPVLASVAVAMHTNPLLLMIPATLSASCAFMFPVATPPNAIVFGSGRVKISDMVRAGIYINIVGILLISLLFYLIGTAVFLIDLDVFPAWAETE
ncbi:sodium:dicarboxylate symporter [Methyloprofundus sedimenti]|uniref:Sodium:dicarboxylate symporter n=1 Tax=Methyloprofundus sedimenti TaxID=1420851 RepID=A0A1V8M8X5_9GAMM|nr:DASS family sodium-coupled anion symporter [Methyloprofundus sedimenti]OQK18041.1 sodium:dicarboxylate symporter [Methyloprofundus sedimenti]